MYSSNQFISDHLGVLNEVIEQLIKSIEGDCKRYGYSEVYFTSVDIPIGTFDYVGARVKNKLLEDGWNFDYTADIPNRKLIGSVTIINNAVIDW